jgi:hypothetical protein
MPLLTQTPELAIAEKPFEAAAPRPRGIIHLDQTGAALLEIHERRALSSEEISRKQAEVRLVPDESHRLSAALLGQPRDQIFGPVVGGELFYFLNIDTVFLIHDLCGLRCPDPRAARDEVERRHQANQSRCRLPNLLLSLGGQRPERVILPGLLPFLAISRRSVPNDQNLHACSVRFRDREDRARGGVLRLPPSAPLA